MKREDGFMAGVLFVLFVIGLALSILSIKWQTSDDIVSGIVYNNTNDEIFSGNTHFSVRASVDTYTDKNNTSSFCLPPNSPYIPLVKEAAADKSIKVVVTSSKRFQLLPPLTCMDNVTVVRAK